MMISIIVPAWKGVYKNFPFLLQLLAMNKHVVFKKMATVVMLLNPPHDMNTIM